MRTFGFLVVLCLAFVKIQLAFAVEQILVSNALYNQDIKAWVWLPNGYDKTRAEPYPVVYFLDGQEIFSEGKLFWSNSWKADKTAANLIKNNQISPVVLVAIEVPNMAERSRSFLPWPDAYLTPFIAKPDGAKFPDFLRQAVIPAVEQGFNVGRGAKRFLAGSSYGGLMSFYTALRAPDLFDGYIIESPSLYVGEGAIFDLISALTPSNSRYYFGIGTHETKASCNVDPDPEPVSDVERAKTLLIKQGVKEDQIMVNVEKCGLHDIAAWTRRLPKALEFVLGGQ